MSFFDAEELIDCLRYNLTLHDNSSAHLSAQIIQPPRRRAPAESLPLELVLKGKAKKGGNDDDEADDGWDCWLEQDEKRPLLRHLLGSGRRLGRGGPSDAFADSSTALNERVRARLMAKLADFEQRNVRRIGTKQRPPTSKGGEIRFEPRQITAAAAAEDQEEQPGTSGTIKKGTNGRHSSMTTRLLAETVAVDDTCSFVEFAKFEAIPNSPNSKRFAIVFPLANCALTVHIVRSARIADLIGLACHIYTRQQREPPCEHPAQYDLFLAEEDSMELDTELPPQDRRRLVADCGFPALAMVARGDGRGGRRRRSSKSSAISGRKPSLADGGGDNGRRLQANIFLTDGRCYAIQLDSLDVPLKQLFDYAMERKRADDQRLFQDNAKHFLDSDYVLETYDKPGNALDLANSLCSIGTHDFVLLRLNSARGDQMMSPLAQQNGISFSAVARQRPSLTQSRSMINIASGRFGDLEAGKKNTLKAANWPSLTMSTVQSASAAKICQNHFLQEHNQARNNAKASFNSMTTALNHDISELRLAQFLHQQQCQREAIVGNEKGIALGHYAVNRMHRFKPKTPTRLVLREHCLELVPISTEQSMENGHHKNSAAILKRAGQQIKRIPWELVAAAEVPPHSEQRSAARRTVRIIWLCCSMSTKVEKRLVHLQQQQLTAEYIFAIFKCCIWKTLLIETAGHEAWNIGVRLSELLDHRPSAVHALYQHSSGASIRPVVAAERAFGTIKEQQHHRLTDAQQQQNPITVSSSSTTGGTMSSSLLTMMPTSATAQQLFTSAGGGDFHPETISTVSSSSTFPPFSPATAEADQFIKDLPTDQRKQQQQKRHLNRLSAMLPFPLKWPHNANK
ncbi:hypothetical protein niasHT_031606 [Heterodera trifolii]|uniref:Sin1 middle CRIM domain-containing protein n=1 Tax=Heterodera trifolii TaxID=157864 RepID=A0ABD2IZM5_9BILA